MDIEPSLFQRSLDLGFGLADALFSDHRFFRLAAADYGEKRWLASGILFISFS